ncbi:MAG: MATE family efflux transporter, partial [Spirochaetota bacterium]
MKYGDDYKKIILLAYPVILSNAIDTIMMMVDRLFLARVGNTAEVTLGGAMGGGVIAWLMQAPILGLLQYTNAMASQNFGRGHLPRCAQVTSQSMYWALLYYPLLLGLSQFIPMIFAAIGHDPDLAAAEWSYSRILLIGSIFALLRIPLNSFFIASNRSNLVMKISFLGLLLNIPLNYWFIFNVPLRLGTWV